MMCLAQRSVYWMGILNDIKDFFNYCATCNQHIDKNKKLADLSEDETCTHYECISMDCFENYSGEHGSAINDRQTEFVWCEKTGQ